jgi:acetyltransferase-like isoleucine patch superfamily enzyme
MKKILAIFLFFIPHPFNRLLRRLAGQKVSPSSRIHIFTFIYSETLQIGDRSVISPLSLIKSHRVTIGQDVHIAPLAIINAPLIKGADFIIGDFSRIFPFCWLEPGEGITIGKQVGVGGHTLIFTHGVWSNYLKGGPVTFGRVTIEDEVWLPWRVFIMPGIRIGKHSIIGANSTVTKDIPPYSLAAGSPAKIIKEGINLGLSNDEFSCRCEEIMTAYNDYCMRRNKNPFIKSNELTFSDGSLHWGSGSKIKIDLQNNTYEMDNRSESKDFIEFLRRYGIRLAPCH